MTNFLRFLMLLAVSASLTGQNLISNGDFESGTTGWSNSAGNGGNATFTFPATGDVHAGSGSLRANVAAVGANAWDVQTIQSGFTATTGLTHSLTFWARATVAGRVVRLVLQNTSYTAQDFTMTTAWTQYTFNFIPTETSLQLKIHYYQTGDFRFDDFVINDPSGGPAPVTSTITPSSSFQDMVGFGGALTWYADRVISSASKNTICDLMFTDLGLDILRLKNWYYPVNYPTNKSTATMDPAHFKNSFDITNELHTLAKARNSNIDVLLCSWSPPKALKSNNALPEGTLKQNSGQFMYKEMAQYWVDILDNISFVPEYISIQNEPGYVNAGWETCEWRPTESGGLPGFDIALDSVYNRIKDRPNVPKILGPEPENLGAALWNGSLNTFREFSTPIKNKPYLYGYNYHLYNYAGGAGSIAASNLNIIRDEFGNHPNFMTEFSSENYNWIDVARMVHANLVEANTSAYIYWELIWDYASPSTMIGMDVAGNYIVKDNYYAIKHFAKYIDKGYTRIAASGSNATLNLTAFRNPAGNQITVVAINNHTSIQPLTLSLSGGASVLNAQAYQSVAGNYWQNLGAVNLATVQNLPGKSLTTFVINTSSLPVEYTSFDGKNSGTDNLLEWKTVNENNNAGFEVMHSFDGNNFDSVGFVGETANLSGQQAYRFIHSGVGEGIHYYQLKQYDISGKESYSEKISVYTGTNPGLVLYPSPFSEKLFIRVSPDLIGTSYSLFNTAGVKVSEGILQTSDSEMNTRNLPSGIYTMHVLSSKSIMVYKVVKSNQGQYE